MSAKRAAKRPAVDAARDRHEPLDINAIAEAQTVADALACDDAELQMQQHHEILSAFVFYVEQHSANTWRHESRGARLPYIYARYVADAVRKLIELERAKRRGGRPPPYTRDELAAAVALLNLHGVANAPARLAAELGNVKLRTVEAARAKGGYEEARATSGNTTRYTVHPNAEEATLWSAARRCAAAVGKILAGHG